MNKKYRKATVSAYIGRTLLQFASKHAGNIDEICSITGIASNTLNDPEARIPVKKFNRLFKEVANRSGSEHFGLAFGRAMSKAHPGGNILLSIMANCRTLGAALEKFVLYHDIMADAIQPRMEQTNDTVSLYWETPPDVVKISRHISEALIYLFYSLIRLLTEGTCQPIEIRFDHPAPSDTGKHRETFAVPVRFDRLRSEIIIQRSCLDIPLHLSDAALLKVLEKYAHDILLKHHSSTQWTQKIIERIQKNLLKGEPSNIASIAKDLGISARGLQMRLKEEGVSYKEIYDSIRKEIAMDQLRDDGIQLCDIAFLLGFSDQSAFNHAFKRWTGRTPRQYRREI